jgi:hypothetical protein
LDRQHGVLFVCALKAEDFGEIVIAAPLKDEYEVGERGRSRHKRWSPATGSPMQAPAMPCVRSLARHNPEALTHMQDVWSTHRRFDTLLIFWISGMSARIVWSRRKTRPPHPMNHRPVRLAPGLAMVRREETKRSTLLLLHPHPSAVGKRWAAGVLLDTTFRAF